MLAFSYNIFLHWTDPLFIVKGQLNKIESVRIPFGLPGRPNGQPDGGDGGGPWGQGLPTRTALLHGVLQVAPQSHPSLATAG